MRLGSRRLARSLRVVVSLVLVPLLGVAAPTADHRARVLWVSADQSVFEVSPIDGTPALELASLPHVQALAVDQRTDHVWVYSRRHLQAYDAQGNMLADVTPPHDFDDDHNVAMAVDGKAGNVWLASGHRLYRFDLTGALIDTIRLHRAPTAMSVDPTHSELWLATDDSLVVLDQSGATVTTVDLHPLHEHPEALSYDATLDQVWVSFHHGLARYDQTGAQVFSVRLDHDPDDLLAPDGQGNVWVADGSTLAHVNQSGSIDFTLRPFAELNYGENHDAHSILGLVADPLNHTAWVASRRHLQQYATDSTLLQTVDSQSWLDNTAPGDKGEDGPGDHWNDWGWFGRDHQGVHRVALYVDTIPPTVSITSPTDGTYTNHNRPAITLNYSDIGSGVDVTQTKITTADGVNIPVTCTATTHSDGATCTPNTALSDGHYSLSVTVADYAGNVSEPATVSLTVDTVPPTITITSPAGQYTNQTNFTLSGHMSETGTLTINGNSVALDNNDAFTNAVKLNEGANTFVFVGTDLAGNTTSITKPLILDTLPPGIPNLGLIGVSEIVNGNVTVTGKAGAVDPDVTVTITDTRTNQSVTTKAAADGSFSVSLAAISSDQFTVSETDEAGNVTNAPTPISASNLPPDPSNVAPPLSATSFTGFSEAISFLYSGATPIQTGVASGAILSKQAAVIQGRVMDADGNPLSGARIAVLDHPELGQTLSRTDGHFDLAVNGGGLLTITYALKNYLSAERQIQVPWNDYAHLDDVVLIKPDSNVTPVSFSTTNSVQVARGSVVTDSDGSRQATIMFMPGTTASMILPDGTTQVLSAAHIRATEYTVGSLGPETMPGPLPPASGYTYAVDLNADEATDAGATGITFSKPVVFYVDNFLNFPPGTNAPVGWFDPNKAAWIPTQSGVVIKILSIDSQGLADLDVSGSGTPASTTTLSALGITDAERAQLAMLYPAGKSLWRVTMAHFTEYDINWGINLPDDAIPPPDNQIDDSNKDPVDPCKATGCIIEAQQQTLRQKIAIKGTSYNLYYSSRRTIADKYDYTLNLQLSGPSIPSDLKAVQLDVSVAGRYFTKTFAPAANLNYVYTWDGKDGYGRRVNNPQVATVSIGFVYDGIYSKTTRFASAGNAPITGDRARKELTLWHVSSYKLGTYLPQEFGGSGWTIGIHHAYSRADESVYYGNGGNKVNTNIATGISTVAGNGTGEEICGDGGPATEACLFNPQGLAIGNDGSLYIADFENAVIRKVSPNGVISTFAGNGKLGNCGDGGPAVDACLWGPGYVAVGPDGSVYVSDQNTASIRKVDSGGTIHTVAGTGVSGYTGDGGYATSSKLSWPQGIAVGPDGSLYIAEFGNNIIRRVGPDGVLTTVAGNRTQGFCGDGGPAVDACLYDPEDVEVAEDGSLYIADSGNHRIRKVTPDGKIHTVVGSGKSGYCGDLGPALDACMSWPVSVAVGNNGSLYVVDATQGRVRRVGSNGIISTVAGTGNWGFTGDGGPALDAKLGTPTYALVGPDGALYIADTLNNRVRVIRQPSLQIGSNLVPSQDGTQLYVFDDSGRQTRTVDAVTGAEIYGFEYDDSGRLAAIRDANGRITEIIRDAAGNPTEVVAPSGQITSLSVDSDGDLTAISDQAGDTYRMKYDTGGLMSSFQDPNGNVDSYTFDSIGRLIKSVNAVGGGWSISRADNPTSYVTTLTSGEGRIHKYEVDFFADGSQQEVNTLPDGTVSTILNKVDGTVVKTSTDGTVTTIKNVPDPRFGLSGEFAGTISIKTPSGLTSSISESRSAPITDPTDPFSFQLWSDTVKANLNSLVSTYEPSTHTLLLTTPMGRKTTTVLDALNRPVSREFGSLATVLYSYDSEGHLLNITSGADAAARTTDYSYFTSGVANGHLKSITDSLGRSTSYQYDAAGRVSERIFPDGNAIKYGYDGNDNVTSITPMARPAHTFSYDGVDEPLTYMPPAINGVTDTATHFTYNKDRQVTSVVRPDGNSIMFDYDPGGRLSTITMPNGMYQYSYTDKTGQVASLSAPDNENLAYTWDGFLNTGTTWTGTVQGSVSRRYNSNFQVQDLSVNGNSISYYYDSDGLLTSAGRETLTRDAGDGLLTGTMLGSVTSARTYNEFAEPLTDSASYNGSSFYNVSYLRDAVGRITSTTEFENGVITTWGYAYDNMGRLASVTKNGVAQAAYGYDANGNRITLNGQVVATYDDQDRLLTYGLNNYAYTAGGELRTKTNPQGTTQYTYDVMGNLKEVKLPDGTDIQYVVDGQNRRVGKEINGKLVQEFLYQSQYSPVAELDGNGNVLEQFVYGSKQNVPDYIVKGGNTYQVISDQLGSPRLVVDSATGTVVEQIEYDTWGNVISDTNPGFQPFGFAGGIYDSDTHLIRFGKRDYDPETGRWTNKDPLLFAGGETSLYNYVGNDPVNNFDPTGLFCLQANTINAIGGAVSGAIQGAAELAEFGPEAALIGGIAGAVIGAATGYMSGGAHSTGAKLYLGAVGGMASGNVVSGAVGGMVSAAASSATQQSGASDTASDVIGGAEGGAVSDGVAAKMAGKALSDVAAEGVKGGVIGVAGAAAGAATKEAVKALNNCPDCGG